MPRGYSFLHLGDFYEMFDKDAVIASKILGITLTARGKVTPHLYLLIASVTKYGAKQKSGESVLGAADSLPESCPTNTSLVVLNRSDELIREHAKLCPQPTQDNDIW